MQIVILILAICLYISTDVLHVCVFLFQACSEHQNYLDKVYTVENQLMKKHINTDKEKHVYENKFLYETSSLKTKRETEEYPENFKEFFIQLDDLLPPVHEQYLGR